MRLANKVAIITGSAGGMGKAAAELFAREGANIVVTDIAAAEGEETARSIRDAGGRAIFIKANAANEDDVRHMVDAAIAAFGHVDVLYNNAGIMPVEDGSVTDITAATWDRVIDVNLKSAFLCSKYVIPHMVKQGKGSIINVASFRLQRRHARPDQIVCSTIWPPRYTLQRYLPRPNRDAYAACAVDERGSPQLAPESHPAGPLRRGEGHCLHGALPGLRRIFLDNGRLAMVDGGISSNYF